MRSCEVGCKRHCERDIMEFREEGKMLVFVKGHEAETNSQSHERYE